MISIYYQYMVDTGLQWEQLCQTLPLKKSRDYFGEDVSES